MNVFEQERTKREFSVRITGSRIHTRDFFDKEQAHYIKAKNIK
jgi:hypothetical protein